MVKRQTALRIRKTHRYLGIFLGIQFLMWTISGLYFSWTDIDQIHGDHLKKDHPEHLTFTGLMSPTALTVPKGVSSVEIRSINGVPYYWVNGEQLYHAQTGEPKNEISKEEALSIADRYLSTDLRVAEVTRVDEVDPHHEYRERLLPAYVVSYEGEDQVKAYVSVVDGKFQTVRHRNWRIFDFLWMTHTMDYEGRDDFNTTVLRIFSLMGLVTVLSGFVLWYVSSPTIIQFKKRLKLK